MSAPSRIEEELLPLLRQGGALEGWSATATGQRSEVEREDD